MRWVPLYCCSISAWMCESVSMGYRVNKGANSHTATLRTLSQCTFFMAMVFLTAIIVLQTQASQFRARKPAGEASTTATLKTKSEPTVVARNGEPPIVLYHNDEGALVACSIPDTCTRMYFDTRVLLVPKRYRAHEKILRRCHNFVKSRRYPESFDPILRYYDTKSPKGLIRWDLERALKVDALGIAFNGQYFSHFAHFAADFLEYGMVPANLFIHNTNASESPTPQCVYPGGTRDCDSRDLPRNPRIVVGNDTHKWTSSLLARLVDVNKSVTFAPFTFSKPTTCFNSVIVSPLKYDIDKPATDRLLRNAGTERTPDKHTNILILTRPWRVSRGTPTKMVRELKQELRKQLNSNGLSETTIETGGMTGLPFDRQVDLMQRADIVISPHGAELSNTMFLRRSSTVIEVFPFGWVYRPFFARMLRAVHAKRVEAYSPPDKKRFESCMKRRHLPKAQRLLYERQENLYRNARTEEDRNAAADFELPDVHVMGACIRSQATVFNVTRLSEIIVNEVQARERRL